MLDDSPTHVRLGDRVTVVIPAYNLASYLPPAVRSVQEQDYPGPITILILDDGSTDGTHAAALAIAAESPSVEVFTQANQGRVGTRNRLLELASTELIAWLDGDDLAHPAWIREQLALLAEHPEYVAVSGHGYAMTASGRALGPILHPLESEEIDRRHLSGQANAFFQSCVLTRKSALQKAGGYREKFPAGEDFDLWLRLAEIGRLANVDRYHLYYRVHDRSANWTVHDQQRMQGYQITNEARARRGISPLPQPPEPIPPSKKDDWNQRIFWINIALKSGNPRSALELLGPAIHRHRTSVLLWIFALTAVADTALLWGNRTSDFRPGIAAHIGSLPKYSCYRAGRWLVRLRRRWMSRRHHRSDAAGS